MSSLSGGPSHGQAGTFSKCWSAQLPKQGQAPLRLGTGGPAGTAAPTWVAEALVAGAHAAAGAVGAGAERAEVHQLGAGGAREARGAAAAEAQALGVAGAVVATGRRGAGVHLLLAGGAGVPCRETAPKGALKKVKPCLHITNLLGTEPFPR